MTWQPYAVVAASLVAVAATAGPDMGEAYTGVTEPIRDATLSVTVRGTVAAIHVDEGGHVREGGVILALDNAIETLEVSRRKLMAESKVELNAAEDRVRAVKEDLDGTRQLFESTQSVSKEELQKKELEYTLAVADQESLKVSEQREAIEYRIALEHLARREIQAPFDGIVTERHVEIGENCEPREPLVRLVDISRCRLVCNLEAAVASSLEVGRKVTIGIDGLASACEGVVDYVSPVVDAASGLQKVKILFENREGLVRPGVSGQLYLGAEGDRGND